jgi:hypothetical protein
MIQMAWFINSIFVPTIKVMIFTFQENVQILAYTLHVMVTIKDVVASNMALNGNTLLIEEIK